MVGQAKRCDTRIQRKVVSRRIFGWFFKNSDICCPEAADDVGCLREQWPNYSTLLLAGPVLRTSVQYVI